MSNRGATDARLNDALTALQGALQAFGGLLEAEWYNGNMDEPAYLRLNADLSGVVREYLNPTLGLVFLPSSATESATPKGNE